MSLSAILYTLAAVGLIILMALRPESDSQATNMTQATDNTTTETSATATTTTSLGTPDYAREQRLAEQTRDAVFEGEVIDLNDGSNDFMAIQTDADEPRGGVIIAHGRGYHPDWEDVANPLRIGLAEQGWTTLSLQMPVLDKQAKYYDYVPLFPNASQRISSGIKHLKEQGISPIILVGHSCGGHMAMHWVRENGDSEIDGFVGLGLGATDFQQFMEEPYPLDKMTVPVLDAYGENEYPAVIKMAPERLAMMEKAGNPHSSQQILPSADHYFKDKGAELTTLVHDWLEQLR